MKADRRRVHLIDEIRGVSIILMVFYHAFYIIGHFFGVDLMQKAQVFFEPLQPLFACLFIFISGISSNLSRSNLKRGLRLFAIALGFTLVTAVILPRFDITGAEIIFGILHLLSVSMLAFALLRKPLEKVPTLVGMAVCIVLFGIGRLQGKPAHLITHIITILYFMIHLVMQYRAWCATPQLYDYFFPLLSSVFLMLFVYHRACKDLTKEKEGAYLFFGQAALFCCFLSLTGSSWLFYASMAAWTTLDLFPRKEQ